MGLVWVVITTVSLIMLMFGSPESAFATLLAGSEKAVELAFKLWAIYGVWLGVLRIVEDTKLDRKIARLLQPLIRKLVGKFEPYVERQVAINLTSNLLGMGNAATPSGINAIAGMHKGSPVATSGMIMFFILNTTNLQIIPSTIIGLRIMAGSKTPNDIIFPTILSSLVSAGAGVLLVVVLRKIFKDDGATNNKNTKKKTRVARNNGFCGKAKSSQRGGGEKRGAV